MASVYYLIILKLIMLTLVTARQVTTLRDVDDTIDEPDPWDHRIQTTTEMMTQRVNYMSGCRFDSDCHENQTSLRCLQGVCSCPDDMKLFGDSCKPPDHCEKDYDCPHSWCDVTVNQCHEVLTLRMLIVFLVLAVTVVIVFLMYFVKRMVRHRRLNSSRTQLISSNTTSTPACVFYCNGFVPPSPAMTATVVPVRV